jgi:hypothetical protein
MAGRAQIRRWLGPASPQYDMSGKEWRVDFIMSVERTFKAPGFPLCLGIGLEVLARGQPG